MKLGSLCGPVQTSVIQVSCYLCHDWRSLYIICLPLLQTVVKVDEEGTEAAAVTAVVFGPTAIQGGASI
jgi:hypothetical protein